MVSLVAQTVKDLRTMQETWVRSLGLEDSLEKGIATHSSILAWRILWTEEHSRLQSMGSQRVRHDWVTNTCPQNKNPLHWWPHSCPHNEDGAMPGAPHTWSDYVLTTTRSAFVNSDFTDEESKPKYISIIWSRTWNSEVVELGAMPMPTPTF